MSSINENQVVYLNGKFMPLSEAHISPLDRGFIFGDGVYEVVPVYHGKPFRLDQHVARLLRTLDGVRIKTDRTADDWKALMTSMIEHADTPDCLVYLQVTRGVAKREHQFPKSVEPTIFMMASPLVRPSAELIQNGMRTVSMKDERWLHCDLKTVSLLGNVFAKQHAYDEGVDDVIMFRDDKLSEASSANIFVIKDGVVHAPIKNNLILEGIRYGFMQELCDKLGIEFKVHDLTRQDVETADELLLTSASKEVVAITELDGQKIGSGKPGLVFQKLRKAYDEVLAAL